MVQLTETAVSKVREILDTQEPKPAGLRIAVVGGGCARDVDVLEAPHTPCSRGIPPPTPPPRSGR